MIEVKFDDSMNEAEYNKPLFNMLRDALIKQAGNNNIEDGIIKFEYMIHMGFYVVVSKSNNNYMELSQSIKDTFDILNVKYNQYTSVTDVYFKLLIDDMKEMLDPTQDGSYMAIAEANKINNDTLWFSKLHGGIQVLYHRGKLSDGISLQCTPDSDGGAYSRQFHNGSLFKKQVKSLSDDDLNKLNRELTEFLRKAMTIFEDNVSEYLKEKGFIAEE